MPLKGIKVLEFVGLAPGPFCGKILADFGASVTRIDKVFENYVDVLQHGKRSLAVNLKNPKGQKLVRDLSKNYDVLIEPFRPNVMEKLNLGPNILCKENPRLIYARLTGFGQTGRLASRAGHDINYVAISGILSMLGRKNEKPTPPINILADFAGGGLICAMGICIALLERYKSGKGQIIDAAMVDGAAYVSSWILMSHTLPLWGKPRGDNILDTGTFYYDTYETKDGRFMSVGALEPQFFEIFKDKIGLSDITQFNVEDKELVRKEFLKRTQLEWSDIFENADACVYPVVEWFNAPDHDHNKSRNTFKRMNDKTLVPQPAPRFSRTPGTVKENISNIEKKMENVYSILQEIGKTVNDVNNLIKEEVIVAPSLKGKL